MDNINDLHPNSLNVKIKIMNNDKAKDKVNIILSLFYVRKIVFSV